MRVSVIARPFRVATQNLERWVSFDLSNFPENLKELSLWWLADNLFSFYLVAVVVVVAIIPLDLKSRLLNMAPNMSEESLLQELMEGNSFFDSVVDMIPAKLYVAGQSGDDFNPKYFKGQHKESKEIRRNKAKSAKRAKLDPSTAETTTETKERLEGNRGVLPLKGTAPASAPATPVLKSPPPTATSSTPEKEEDDATPDSDPTTDTSTAVIDNKSRIDALRAKLHAKLAEKRGQRPSDPNVVSKRAGRAAEKKKRQEEAKAKKKKNAHTKAETEDAKGKPKSFYESAAQNNDPAQDLANLDFGLLHGLNNKSSNEQYQKQNKSLRNLSKNKNLEKMLADAETKRQRVQDLKQSTDEADKIKAANIQWGDLIKEASGERVKDDPAKLKKAMKQKAAQKTKSAKAWKTRMDQTQQKMDDRQKIRSNNLKQRVEGGKIGANLTNKKLVKRDDAPTAEGKKPRAGPRAGAGRAGFEGRKQEFLNKKGQ